MEVNIGKTSLKLVKGNITDQDVEGIVSAANDRLWMGGGVAGSIKEKGGEKIEEEAMSKGPANIGDVIVTSAGNLLAQKVLHAVVMGQELNLNKDSIRSATHNSLNEAAENGVKTLAIPAFGTGVGHFPAEDCADIMINEVINFLIEKNEFDELRIVFSEEGIYDIFREKLDRKFSK